MTITTENITAFDGRHFVEIPTKDFMEWVEANEKFGQWVTVNDYDQDSDNCDHHQEFKVLSPTEYLERMEAEDDIEDIAEYLLEGGVCNVIAEA